MDVSTFPRIPLGSWPTPLDPCPRLSAAVGATVLVKRDDVGGLGLGGSKLRKLEFTLAAALAAGADTIITFGAVQTNHGRLTAAACARLGLRCELVLTRDAPLVGFAYDRSGNVALDHLFGARLHICDTDDEATATANTLATKTSVTLPVGGSSGLGVLGYVVAAQELTEQLKDQKVDRIVVAAGSGGTAAGLVLGTGMPVTAVSVSRDAAGTRERIERAAGLAVKELGVDLPKLDHLTVDDSAVGEGYGIPTDDVWAALRLFARTEGIVLDPVYTGKAAAGLIKGIRKDETVVFVHTGGVPAIYGYTPDLVAEAGR